jgi:Ca2+-binding RTX toxin-like protein
MKSRNNSCTPAAPFEELESRRLFSASLSGSTLNVYGTPGYDTLQVTLSQGPVVNVINVYDNGITTGFPARLVTNVQVHGFAGNDTIGIGGGVPAAFITGGDGDDYIVGGNAADSLWGGNGNDTIVGGAGNDYIRGEADNDTIYGDDGNDDLSGGFGDDTLYGGAGNDGLYGDAGSDWLIGNAGYDSMYGGDGNDYFTSKDGEYDYISGGAGWDTASIDKREWWEFWGVQDGVSSDVEQSFEP